MVVLDRHPAYCCGGWSREREELFGREVALVNLRASWWPAQDSLPTLVGFNLHIPSNALLFLM